MLEIALVFVGLVSALPSYGIGELPPQHSISQVSQLAGLPAWSPSSMPTRYYDATEYDVAPLQLPLFIPNPPPPPSFMETSATMQTKTASAESIRAAATAAAVAAARNQPQPPMRQVFSRYPGSVPTIRASTQPSLVQQSENVYRNAQATKHHSRHHAKHAVSAEQLQQQRQNEFAAYAERMRFAQRPSMMETQSSVRAMMSARAALAQQQHQQMQAEAAGLQRAHAQLGVYLNADHFGQRAERMAARPQQPEIAMHPESIAAEGYVPHFAPPVRALPSAAAPSQQPYAAFFESQANGRPSWSAEYQRVVQANPYAGRPQEPFLPRLPPPPIVLGE